MLPSEPTSIAADARRPGKEQTALYLTIPVNRIVVVMSLSAAETIHLMQGIHASAIRNRAIDNSRILRLGVLFTTPVWPWPRARTEPSAASRGPVTSTPASVIQVGRDPRVIVPAIPVISPRRYVGPAGNAVVISHRSWAMDAVVWTNRAGEQNQNRILAV